MRRLAATLILTVLAVLPAAADVRFESVTRSGGQNPNEQMDMTILGYTQGEVGNFYIQKSSNPFMKEGMYLHTSDGGNSMVLVDPKEETYSEWDLDEIIQMAGTVIQALGGLVKIEVENPKVELVSKGAGAPLHGLSTEVYVFETSYALLTRVMGIKQQQLVEEKSTITTTQELSNTSAGVMMRTDPPKTGTELDQMIEASPWGKIDGVAVAYRTDTRIVRGKKQNKVDESWSEMTVTALDRSSGGPPGGYGYPDHYTQVSMMPTAAMTGEQPEEDGKKRRFPGFRRDGGD